MYEIIDALVDDDIVKCAFNSAFERICLSYWLRHNYPEKFISYNVQEDTVGNYPNPQSWRCTMIWSAYMGLPLSLEGVGAVLGLKDQKMKEGKDLIRYFCVPYKPTKRVMATAPETFRHMLLRNGKTLNPITSVISKWKWESWRTNYNLWSIPDVSPIHTS